MNYPSFVFYQTVDEYKEHYEKKYCQTPIITFDGISVRFRRDQFAHCFYESSQRNGIKDIFSEERKIRIDWIKAALHDPNAELFVGWDKKKKRADNKSRVTLVVGNYVVVIRLTGNKNAKFVTAYIADSTRTLEKIKRSPRWTPS